MADGGRVDVAVVGGGQAGLATGYFLRRARADFVILDERDHPGGAWTEYWDSLRLFSPPATACSPGGGCPPKRATSIPAPSMWSGT